MIVSDVIIFLPGISGSVLRKDGKTLWGTDLGGVWGMLTSGGDSIRSLALTHGDDPSADDIDGIEATALVPDLHLIPGLWKIDGYTKVSKHLVRELTLKPGENFFEFPYDWRRDNRVASRKLGRFARSKLAAWRESSGKKDARLVFVVHSMGGLVARGFMDGPDQGWVDTRALITIGTPHRGSLNALGYIANGFSKRVGPVKFDLSDTLRSFTGLYQLLPHYEVIDRGDGHLLRVDETAGLPHLDPDRAKAAMQFYQELEDWQNGVKALPTYAATAPRWYPITGTFQPTEQSARFDGQTLTLLKSRHDEDQDGDGTVPRISAMPIQLQQSSAGMFADQVHASLQNDDAVLNQVVALIKGLGLDYGLRAEFTKVALLVDDVYVAGAPVVVRAKTNPSVASLTLALFDARRPADEDAGRLGEITLYDRGDEWLVGEVNLDEGAYRIVVADAANITPAADCFLVIADDNG